MGFGSMLLLRFQGSSDFFTYILFLLPARILHTLQVVAISRYPKDTVTAMMDDDSLIETKTNRKRRLW